MPTSRGTLLAGLLLLLPAPQIALAADSEFVGNDRFCMSCHAPAADHPLREILRGPHGKTANGCESCHGPSANHVTVDADGRRPPPPATFRASEAPATGNAQCLSCHQASGKDMHHWETSLHRQAELSCVACHDGHAARDVMRDVLIQNTRCTDCHTDIRAQLHRRSAHPLRDGQQACTACHVPHGAANDAMLVRNSINETCYSCHAEKRGPFLFEHPPARENCMNCHEAHGAAHRALLSARTPWLCQQCHMAQFHPSTALSGSGLPSSPAPSPLMLGRDCMNCHVQVHGSNHPSGAGQTR